MRRRARSHRIPHATRRRLSVAPEPHCWSAHSTSARCAPSRSADGPDALSLLCAAVESVRRSLSPILAASRKRRPTSALRCSCARDQTERPEALAFGGTRLVPLDKTVIVDAILAALERPRPVPLPFAIESPFGDGRSALRIAERSGKGARSVPTAPLPRMNGAATAAATTAQALRDWLIDGPAQLDSGPEAGAVAGTIEPSGAVHYVYGEITGYYLHWLASGAVEVADATRKAQSALAWIVRRYGGSTPAADTNPSDRRRRRLAKPRSVLFRSGDARRRSRQGGGAQTDRRT